ncbi:M23 family metallopeptidase [Streptomyces sp. B1866]|uniref:M23 family metallopeptidase n=1 Tax=Streptomyces sp. B1866 TaxID=3075431 RepID=UPI0028912A31|nr:M23 family metallopeptidase [Streptomyces sp. B1866]MDT3396831.1 M23 family metallopeptidase [Streptomyces sp. B1866]
MLKRAKTRHSSNLADTSAKHTRTTVLGVGLGAALALGAGAGVALAGQGPSDHVASVTSSSALGRAVDQHADVDQQAVQKQAAAQHKAAEKEAAAKREAQRDARLAAQKAAKKAAAKKAAKKAAARKAARHNPHAWITPVASYAVGSTFGIDGSHWKHKHSGQDFVVPTGTRVDAVHGGTVVKAGGNGAGDGPAYGNAIVIRHADNTYSQYAHLSKVEVHVGQKVKTGQEIGRAGSTGNSTGPHLHFEIRTTPNYGSGVEPLDFLRHHHVKV